MNIDLNKKPKNVTIVEGFPGFGLVGTISTEFLINHLNAEKIGTMWYDELTPLLMIHEGKRIEPLGVFYSKRYNLVILHALADVKGYEWRISKAIDDLCKQLSAKEIISIEGVGAMVANKEPNVYYLSKNSKAWINAGVEELKEGIVIGVTAALLMKLKSSPISCIFAETSSNLPDSRASARVIEALDKYLKLKVDYRPLLKKAEEFEVKVKELVKKGNQASKDATKTQKDKLSYFG